MALCSKRPSRGDEVQKRLLKEVRDTRKKKRLNVEIEENIYTLIKIRAVEEGVSVSDITRSLWVEYLSV